MIQEAVQKSYSVSQVMTYLGCKITGGGHSHMTKRIKIFGIDTSHFTGKTTNKGPNHRGGNKPRPYTEILIKSDKPIREKTNLLKRCMIEAGVKYQCNFCDNDGQWNTKPLTLHIDHVDGDWRNNEKSNLRFLCPNCHSQTETYGNKKHVGVV